MTGFGSDVRNEGHFSVETSIRSLNHRYLQIKTYLPDELTDYEYEIREMIADSSIQRGILRVDVKTHYFSREQFYDLNFDKALLENYLAKFKDITNDYDIPIATLMAQLPEFAYLTPNPEAMEKIWGEVKKSLARTLKLLIDMRVKEGENLRADLLERLEKMGEFTEGMESNKEALLAKYTDKLYQRIGKLIDSSIKLDPEKILQEAALYAEKSDYTEEITRIKSHLTQVEATLNEGGLIGSKLKFLVQELHREVNTIGSKALSQETSIKIVDFKEELERVREQIQNIQ